MSLKYERIKQADLALPTPVRWLTRAFSSITLAVILLLLIALYGVLASMPLLMLVLGAIYGGVILACVGIAFGLTWALYRFLRLARGLTVLVGAGLFLLAVVASWYGCVAAYGWFTSFEWYQTYRAVIIYRLPMFEMTELQFYTWWPMQVLLGLFVVNMVWATVRRIEFRFMNIGVLTVHTGIVTIAIGSMLYGHFKVEGDMFLQRQDIGGGFHNTFYDVFDPALYLVTHEGESVMIPLDRLPRYNDYALGELNKSLTEKEGVQALLGEDMRITLPGFIAYGELRQGWSPVPEAQVASFHDLHGPSVRLMAGTRDAPLSEHESGQAPVVLVADIPAERVYETARYTIELLHNPSEERMAALNTETTSMHGLIVRLPELDYEEVLDIFPEQTITLGDTGYELTVEEIGPYNLPFVTAGYEDAQDTQARVRITGPDMDLRRIVLHRYPERSQDFVPQPDNANAGPLGVRQDPDPRVELIYLDNTRTHYRLLLNDDLSQARLHLRIPGTPPMVAPLLESKFPLPSPPNADQVWVHLVSIDEKVAPSVHAVPAAQSMRNPRDEGTYVNALLPVQLEKLGEPDVSGERPVLWEMLVWLPHLRYPHLPEPGRTPAVVNIPDVGPTTIAFSRVRHHLPFAVALEDFEMVSIPGSDIEQNFIADLLIAPVDQDGLIRQQPRRYQASLNYPLTYRTPGAPLATASIKISQIQWDRGDLNDPERFARDEHGRFINQQRFSVLGIANNVGIRIIAFGAILIAIGIPWAFWVKPWLLQRESQRLRKLHAKQNTK